LIQKPWPASSQIWFGHRGKNEIASAVDIKWMEHFVSLGDGLLYAESLAEFDRVFAEMETTKAQIDGLIEEQARINRLC
jgi:hypothetical protein